MSRKYSLSLLDAMVKNQSVEIIDGQEVIVKPIPDCDIPGAMDPRLYASAKKMALMMKFIPKSFMKMDTSPKSIARLRKMFNSVDSTPTVEEPVDIKKFTVKAKDGYEIPMKKFESKHTLENAPVLYFIHGGGFFAGSSEVVTEALKMIVTNTGIIAYAVDYRLAPENPYPTGHEDCYSGLEWIFANTKSHGGDPSNIFVAGDSAGGNLTAYCTNRNIFENTDMIKGQMLLYPTVNMGGVSDPHVDFSVDKVAVYEKQKKVILPTLTMMDSMKDTLGDILGTNDIMTPYLTPYMAVSEKSPVSFISVGEHDFLVIETLAYARKLRLAGVHTETYLYRGMGHAYIDQIGNYPQGEDCAIEMGKFILKHSGRA